MYLWSLEEFFLWREILQCSPYHPLLSRPFWASHPAGCRVASPHAVASHLMVPPPLTVSLLLVPLVRLVVASLHFSCEHLPSAGASASHRAVASCHASLRPLVLLVKALPLLMPLPPICRIIGSSQWSVFMLTAYLLGRMEIKMSFRGQIDRQEEAWVW